MIIIILNDDIFMLFHQTLVFGSDTFNLALQTLVFFGMFIEDFLIFVILSGKKCKKVVNFHNTALTFAGICLFGMLYFVKRFFYRKDKSF